MKIQEIITPSILTKTNLPVGDFSVNPYVGCTHACKYCYASFMKRFTNHPEPWGEFLDVKFWQPIKSKAKLKGKSVFFGSVTDPYLPEEEKYQRTKALLEELKGTGVSVSIATKSDLVLRDLELIKSFENAQVSWSINTLDEEFRGDMDKGATIERRLRAMKIFHDAGIKTTCFISPIFPGLTNLKEIIERSKGISNIIWLENLNLRGSFKSVILNYIKEKHPHLTPLYDEIYSKKDNSYWEFLNMEMKEFAKEMGYDYLTNVDTHSRKFEEPPVIVNFFYHSQITKSAVKKAQTSLSTKED